MAEQPWAGTLFQDDMAPMCIGSEQPQPQAVFREAPFCEQAQPLAGPLHEHSDAHPQSWHPVSVCIPAAAQSSAPWTPTISANEIATGRARKIKAFILRTPQLIPPCGSGRKK